MLKIDGGQLVLLSISEFQQLVSDIRTYNFQLSKKIKNDNKAITCLLYNSF